MPEKVIERAKDILQELVSNAEKEKMAVRQLSFDEGFLNYRPAAESEKSYDDLVKELEKVDVNVLTPIEALNILNKLKSML